MSSETDHPRQRTVAELLAQHGNDSGSTTGRRRRRRESDDPVDEPGAPGSPNDADAGGGAPSTAWPTSRSPMPERSSPQPPPALAGPARGADPPRPPTAMPPAQQQYAPNGSPATGAHPTGRNGSPNQNQWGPPARREPDRPQAPEQGFRPDGFAAEQVDPRRDRMPTGGWGAQPRPGQSRDRQPAPPADGSWNGGQRPEQGPPPRAFAPGPEPTRGAPPHAQSPHAGAAGLPASAQFGGPPTQLSGRPVFDQPTGANPAYGRPAPPQQNDPGLTGPIDQQRMQALSQVEATSRVQDPRRAPDPDGGPATAVGLPPAGAEDWHRSRVGPDRADDGGPATAVGIAPAGAEDWHRSRVAPGQPQPDRPQPDRPQPDRPPPGWPQPDDGGPATEAAAPMDFDDFDGHPAGLGPVSGAMRQVGGPDSGGVAVDEDADAEERAGQSWAPVLAQWVIGAIGGAALWVGFRYLWSSLLVVAIAAAILVTAGLVVVVRTLLHNRDLRTSVSAGAVGILLTVSPAVLVLLGR